MTSITNLAYPYVNALFEIADNDLSLDKWLEDLESLAIAASDSEFSDLIKNPEISKDDLLSTLLSFTSSKTLEMKNFLSLIIKENRLLCLSEIYQLFKEKIEKSRNSATAVIQSAFPLNDTDKKDFAQILSK